MDLSRRAWNRSKRAKTFYEEQQRLWVELLLKFLPDQAEEVLQLFQGALFAHLITSIPSVILDRIRFSATAYSARRLIHDPRPVCLPCLP
jgi:hypothetical protein